LAETSRVIFDPETGQALTAIFLAFQKSQILPNAIPGLEFGTGEAFFMSVLIWG
jgi:hypothetical protein